MFFMGPRKSRFDVPSGTIQGWACLNRLLILLGK